MIAKHEKCPFHGSYVALPTPFRGGQLDYASLKALIDFHIANGTDGFVIAGTTGEAATLSDTEKRALYETSVAMVRGRLPVILGVGTNCTRTTVEMATYAAGVGADGVLVVTPYYNKPSKRGLVLHFSQVADAVGIPVVLYNVPSRTGIDMVPEVVAELGAKNANVVAVKEALPSTERVKRLVAETDVAVFCGDDGAIADFMGLGAVGVIGVLNNIVPAEVAELVRCASPGGDSVRAAALVEFCAPLVRDLFIETSPVPVKTALALMKHCSDEVRPPLAALEAASLERLRATLEVCELI